MRARLRFFFSPSRANTRAIACASGSNLLRRQRTSRTISPDRERRPARRRRTFQSRVSLRRFRLPRCRDQAHVVHARQAAGMLRAAAERRLEFPAEVLAIGMAQQEFRKRARIRRDVEHFVRADARVGASGDVAHGISASLARRDARGRQPPHHAGRVVNVNVVKLKILPRGHVRDAVGIFLGQTRPASRAARRSARRRES